MPQKFDRNAMERELRSKIEGALVVPKPQNRNRSRSRGKATVRFCFVCLRHGGTAPPITDAHVFNRSQRAEWPPSFATWTDMRRRWIIFPTGIIINGIKTLFIGGRWDELRRLFVPICEECRKKEQVPDWIAQQVEVVRGIAGGTVTLTGFPSNTDAVVRAGDVITIEDWRLLAKEVVRLKTKYYLDAMAVWLGGSPQSIEWWHRFLLQHPARQPLIDGLQHDYVTRARIVRRDGVERWRHRVLQPKPRPSR